jgi:hypothetical protein
MPPFLDTLSEPMVPAFEALSCFAGDLENAQFRIDLQGIFFDLIQTAIHMGKKVDLVDEEHL